MAQVLTALETRLGDILFRARGADNSLGLDAAQRSIPADRFRPVSSDAPLRDPSYPREQFDRAARFEWLSVGDEGNPNNPLNGPQFRRARLALVVGYAQGADVAIQPYIKLSGSETAAGAAMAARLRALSDAERIYRALAFPALLTGAPVIDPVPLSCFREGASEVEDLGDGRLLCTTVYAVRFESQSGTTYDP